jgi:hypothetical protein
MKAMETRIVVLWWDVDRHDHGSDTTSQWGEFGPMQIQYHKELLRLLQEVNPAGWVVSAVLPLEQGIYFADALQNKASGYLTWGAGYGYGVSGTAGASVILQRDIDDLGSDAAKLRAALYEIQLKRSQESWEVRITPIKSETRKTGFLSTATVYLFDGKEYESFAAARVARSAKADKIRNGTPLPN